MMARGKPTITPDQVEQACQMIAEGKSLREACRSMGLNEASVRYHLNKTEEAFTQTAHARELGCDALADECIEIADNPLLDPADRRVRIETRLKLIGKWSQRYSDKVTVKSESTVTHKHDLSALDTTELEQLEAILAKSERSAGDTGEAVASSVH